MWLNDILTANEKGNPSDVSDLQKTKVGQKIAIQHIENTALSDVSDLSDPKKDICEVKTIKEAAFCPLNFLLEHDVGIASICPLNGITLATGYSCTQELRHRIEFWTLGYFDRLLATLGETRVITKKVHCISLNRYKLPRA